MSENIKIIAQGSLIVMGALLFFASLRNGIAGSERAECLQLFEAAKENQNNPNFYITSWQDQQCRHYNIIINAPIEQ